MATPDELVAANATALAAAQKTASLAYDATRHFGNMKQVVSTGQAGALALADTLATAPVGDQATVRNNIGLGSAATRSITGDGAAMAVGYGGWGGYSGFQVNGLQARLVTGVYMYSPGNNGGFVGGCEYGTMLNLQNDGPDWRSKFFMPADSSKIFYLHFANGTWHSMGEIMMKGVNCTVDGNGFLKASSPILRLGRREDTITDHSFSPANYGATNEEAEGVTCERVGEGVYRVSGSLGFADDGAWTIETPRDDNNQPLLWVNTKQDADGTITVETYHRTHPDAPTFAQNNIDGKAPNDPIDVPIGRWIDLRLKMPELVKADEKSK